MLIRSQDKKTIINLDNVCQVRTGGAKDSRIIVFADDQVIVLGDYSTEEKAIKVLDMICEHAVELHFSTIVPDRCGAIYGNVFNLPQDSEV